MGFSVSVYAGAVDRARTGGWARVGVSEVADALDLALQRPGQPWSTAEAVLVCVPRAPPLPERVADARRGVSSLAHVLSRDTQSRSGRGRSTIPAGSPSGATIAMPKVLATARAIMQRAGRRAARSTAPRRWPGQGGAAPPPNDRISARDGGRRRRAVRNVALMARLCVSARCVGAGGARPALMKASDGCSSPSPTASPATSSPSSFMPKAVSLFADLLAAERAGIDAADMIGKTLAAVFGTRCGRAHRTAQPGRAQTGRPSSPMSRTGAPTGRCVSC